MKINEKNLCAYAVSSTATADKEGYLMKKGEVNKGFQKRWFVLKGNLLFYFEKRFDKEPLGVIILEGCTIELDENDAQFSFKIVFHGMGNRSYVLCADSQESMEQWMKSLACASYDYMKLMVTELQRQLKEIRCHKVTEKNTDQPNCDTFINDIAVVSINEENLINISDSNSRVSNQNINSSPQPPPRNRQNVFYRTQGQPQGSSQLNHPDVFKSKSATGVSTLSQGHGCNPQNAHPPFPNQRNKIIFKDIHSAFGRPVLRDRNEWRYKRKENVKSDNVSNQQHTPFREQNLLISL